MSTLESFDVHALSWKMESQNKLVVAIETTMPVLERAEVKTRTIQLRSAGVASIGTKFVIVDKFHRRFFVRAPVAERVAPDIAHRP